MKIFTRTFVLFFYRRLTLTAIISFLALNCAFAQLSGTYTVGGTNADFPTPDSAANALRFQGGTGAVTFNIRPGTYNGFSLIYFPSGITYPDTVIFQSETHDSSDVILTGNQQAVIYIYDGRGIIFKWLTFESTRDVFDIYALELQQCRNWAILNCVFHTPNASGSSPSQMAFKGNNPDGATAINHISNCHFTGGAGGIFIAGTSSTRVRIAGNRVESTGLFSIKCQGANYVVIDSNLLNGKVENGYLNGQYFRNNIVNGEVDIIFDSIYANTFIADTSNAVDTRFKLHATCIKHNTFYGSVSATPLITGLRMAENYFSQNIRIPLPEKQVVFSNNVVGKNAGFGFCENCTVIQNLILGELLVSQSNYSVVTENEVKLTARVSGSTGSLVYKNKFHGSYEGLSQSQKVYNNFISGYVVFDFAANSEFYYNNISIGASFWITRSGANVQVKYNNLWQPANLDNPFHPISHNNYSGSNQGQSNADAHPYYYNPQYVSNTDLYATNPVLIGKGKSISYVTDDFDGASRDSFPTIGANEICLNSALDSVFITCGDEVVLKTCETLGAPFTWLPAAGLNTPLLPNPVAKPDTTTQYTLFNSSGLPIDSVVVSVKKYVELPLQSDSITLGCAQVVHLGTSFNASAVYAWSPAEGLDDSTVYSPLASPLVNTLYIRQTNVPGCGSFTDSVQVTVHALPIIDFWNTSIDGHTLHFQNYSMCADTFYWYFGDGSLTITYTLDSVAHYYDTAGAYIVTLVGCNSLGCDSFKRYAGFYNTSITSSYINDQLQVYPNPFNTELSFNCKDVVCSNIPYSISNSLGNKMLEGTLTGNAADTEKIDVRMLPPGFYLIELLYKGQRIVKRLVKSN